MIIKNNNKKVFNTILEVRKCSVLNQIDAIGGWISVGVGNSYGDGYPLEVKHERMNKIILFMNQS